MITNEKMVGPIKERTIPPKTLKHKPSIRLLKDQVSIL